MKALYSLFLFVLPISLCGCSSLPARYMDVDTGAPINLGDTLKKVEDARVVFVGGFRADRKSHRVQLEVIRHLDSIGQDVIIATDAVPAEEQPLLDEWIKDKVDRELFKESFSSIAAAPYRYYEHILELARAKKIPVVSIHADTTLMTEVQEKGYQSLPAGVLRKYRYSNCAGSPEYAELLGFSPRTGYPMQNSSFPEDGKYEGGDAKDHAIALVAGDIGSTPCDCHRFRDALLAYNISLILQDSDATVVVLTGVAQALRPAVPEVLQKHAAVPYKIILPGESPFSAGKNLTPDIADYVWY